MAEPIDAKPPELTPKSDIEIRKESIVHSLRTPYLKTLVPDSILIKLWLEEPLEDLDSVVSEGQKAGALEVSLPQYADAMLHSESDAKFADAFLTEFGAVANVGDQKIPVRSTTLADICRSPQLAKASEGEASRYLNQTVMLTDSVGKSCLIVQTKIPGVRMAMDGSSVSNPNSSHKEFRPWLLIGLK
jgi:hypothetical protein